MSQPCETTVSWLLPSPFVQTWKIEPQHIDHYNHVNNVAYLSRLESLAWAHSNHLGLKFADYQDVGKGMVIRRHELDYLQPSHLNDELLCATWIKECDGKITLTRQFQFVCPRRNKTVFQARTQFVCVNMQTGAPARMPALFRDIYTTAAVNS